MLLAKTFISNGPMGAALRFLQGLGAFVIAGLVILVAVANRQTVVFSLFPLPWSLEWPLYGLVLLAFAVGAIWGGVMIWWRQRRWRRLVRVLQAEKKQREAAESVSPAVNPPMV